MGRDGFARPLLRDILGYHLGAGQEGVHGLFASAESEAAGGPPLCLAYIGGWDEDPDVPPARGRRSGAVLLGDGLARGAVRYGLLVTGPRLRLLRRPGDGPRGACLELDIPAREPGGEEQPEELRNLAQDRHGIGALGLDAGPGPDDLRAE